MSTEYEVDAATMRDALSGLPGVVQVDLEFDAHGAGVLRVRLGQGVDEDAVVDAAVAGLRRVAGVGIDGSRLRLCGPSGRPVVAVVETHAPEPDEAAGPAAPIRVGRPPTPPPPVVWQPLAQRGPTAPTAEPDAGSLPGESGSLPGESGESGESGASGESGEPPTPSEQPSPPDSANRLVLERVEVAYERVQMWATVHLTRGESTHTGSAGATATGSGAHRAVAAATARAAESALGGDVRLDVEAVDVLGVGQDQVGIVIVTLLTERGVDRLTGAALVRGDGGETIVRATLDALNRRTDSIAAPRPTSHA